MNDHLAYRLMISFLVAFYSGLPGLWMAGLIKRKNITFFNAVKNYELTRNLNIYKFLGIDLFVYCIKNSFFKSFNTKIKITRRPNVNEINDLLNELAISELCHIFGFAFVLIFQMTILTVSNWYDMLIFTSVFNIILNVYPVLLQERNKLRLKSLSNALQE